VSSEAEQATHVIDASLAGVPLGDDVENGDARGSIGGESFRHSRLVTDQRRRTGELVDQDLNTQLVASALGAMLANYSYVSFVLGENFDIDESVSVLTDIWIKALGID
jgi:hypothetical protein|tara:strand:+ start:183 stop:506 length:324 start_codon:yes stop_codon:yes gene_type:complete